MGGWEDENDDGWDCVNWAPEWLKEKNQGDTEKHEETQKQENKNKISKETK